MTISELIKELTTHLETRGDLPVALGDWAQGFWGFDLDAPTHIEIVPATLNHSGVSDVLVIGEWH
jgi:hypothetical protein